MSVQTDRPDDSKGGERAFWLGQVSEAATALSGRGVPSPFSGNTSAFKVSLEPTSELSVVRELAFNPEVIQAQSHFGSISKVTLIGGLVVISAATLTAIIVAGQVTLADVWQQAAIDRTFELASFSRSLVPLAMRGEPSISRLVVQTVRGPPGEPAPLGLTVRGPADGAVVHIKGLVPGMELSAGNAVGPDAWEIPVSELDNAWIAPPEGFFGSADLVAELRLPDNKIADRQTIVLEWGSPSPRSLEPTVIPIQLNRQQIVAGPPMPPETAQTQTSGQESHPPIRPAHQGESDLLSLISTVPPSRQLDQDAIVATLPTREASVAAPPSSAAPRHAEVTAALPISPALAQRQTGREEITAAPPISPAPAQRQLDQEPITAAPPISSEPAQRNTTPSTSAAPPPAQLNREEVAVVPVIPRQFDREEIAVLLKRGKDLIAAGDLAAARLVLQRAADANDLEATLALAATYDPHVLKELKVYSLRADVGMARAWYEKARQLGSSAASRRLEMLSSGPR